MNIAINYTPLVSFGYITCKVPDDVFQSVKNQTLEMISNNFHNAKPRNNYLAGQIKHEYTIVNTLLEKFATHAAHTYSTLSNNKNVEKIKHGETWANFQRKYEYNPPHMHSGALSYVLWVQIPFLFEQELEHESSINSNCKQHACFCFTYATSPDSRLKFKTPLDIASETIRADKNYEGTMIIFPSWLTHYVNPFYSSDDYRISVSGNLYVDD